MMGRASLWSAPVILKLTSAFGLIAMIGLAWLWSERKRLFPWRAVIWGVALQVVVGLFVFNTSAGLAFFNLCQSIVDRFIAFANEGNRLVFGPLAQPETLGKAFGPENTFIFVVTVTGTIILVAAVSSLLYHYGILQLVVRGMAWAMRKLMGTSGSETLAAAANIFMGQTEAPLVVRPYLGRMTRSEVLCLMVGGFATIAGGVLSVYAGVLKVSAGHLITASVMSAPAALLIAKVLVPETEQSVTAAGATATVERQTINAVDALCTGASDGVKMAINVAAMLIAFVALVAAANWLLSQGALIFGWHSERPLQQILGYVNAPFAWLMGVPSKDCLLVGQILGERVVLNEFFGYISLTAQKAALEERSYTLATYALCGFANIGSIAIQVGGLGSLAPERRGDFARLGFKAMIGGLLACYMTACVAGILL
jgi:concentrative nucleoside transporter, CNT family